jgi:diacylglycerol kinase (ATP)
MAGPRTEERLGAVDPESPHKGRRGLRRLLNAFFYSLAGLRQAFLHESAFRQEILLTGVLLPVALLVEVSAAERVLLVGSLIIVLIVELLNSSVEAAVDRIGFDTHRLSKRAKDLGSAAVLLALILLGATWLLILGPLATHALNARSSL